MLQTLCTAPHSTSGRSRVARDALQSFEYVCNDVRIARRRLRFVVADTAEQRACDHERCDVDEDGNRRRQKLHEQTGNSGTDGSR